MREYGIYQIQKDGEKWVVIEQFTGKVKKFDTIADVAQYIEKDLNEVDVSGS